MHFLNSRLQIRHLDRVQHKMLLSFFTCSRDFTLPISLYTTALEMQAYICFVCAAIPMMVNLAEILKNNQWATEISASLLQPQRTHAAYFIAAGAVHLIQDSISRRSSMIVKVF